MTDFNTKNPILIDIPMPIVTDRMVIREPRFGDGAALNAAKSETWDDLHKWMPWAKDKSTVQDDEMSMRKAHVKFLQRTDLMMLAFDKNNGQLLGGTGLHRFDWDTRIMEIGYWYRQSIHGQGLATEGTKALIKYAFGALQAHKVVICYADGNKASQRVIEKCGFDFEYTVKGENFLNDGKCVDEHVYGLYNANHLNDFNATWEGQTQ